MSKSILMWDKPKKVLTTDQWREHYGFDGGPEGGYMPNMSESDMMAWKAKLVGTKTGYPQVEIRKTAGSQMTIVVSLGGGYNYKHYTAVSERYKDKSINELIQEYDLTKQEAEEMKYPTKGINLHIALNGPAQLTFQETAEMMQAIAEAKECLEDFAKTGKKK